MKNQYKRYLSAALLLSGSVAMNSVYAAGVTCGTTSGLNTGDVTFRLQNSDDCAGQFTGSGPLQNDSLTVVNNNTFVSGGVFGGGWQSMARDNTDPSETDITANFLGINWSLTSSAVNSGAWTLNIADPSPANLPVKVDLLAVLKGGAEGWVGYLFTSEIFTVTGPYAGTFDIQFANGGSQQPTLSHLSVYLRGRECTVNDNCGGGGGPGNSIPEPAQLALIGIGFLVMALARRNSRQA